MFLDPPYRQKAGYAVSHFTDDDQIDSTLNFTFNKPQKRTVKVAMSNTFGFGGHNACVLFKKFE